MCRVSVSDERKGMRIERHCVALFYPGPAKLQIPHFGQTLYDQSRVTSLLCSGSIG